MVEINGDMVAQQCAVDVWYQVLTDIEEMSLSGPPFCWGAADIHKFFDQVLRPIVYKLAKLAGMPAGMLRAYAALLEAMTNCRRTGPCTPEASWNTPRVPPLHDDRGTLYEAMGYAS